MYHFENNGYLNKTLQYNVPAHRIFHSFYTKYALYSTKSQLNSFLLVVSSKFVIYSNLFLGGI